MPKIAPPPKLTLGQRLLHYRREAGITQLALAHAIGYTGPDAGSYISRLEADTTEPRLRTLRRLAAALKVPVELFTK